MNLHIECVCVCVQLRRTLDKTRDDSIIVADLQIKLSLLQNPKLLFHHADAVQAAAALASRRNVVFFV